MLAASHLVEAPDRAIRSAICPLDARHAQENESERRTSPGRSFRATSGSAFGMTMNENARQRETSSPNESLRRVNVVAALLDDAIRVPGTKLRFGVDPLVGLIPGLGDLLGGAASAYILLEAARAGAPSSVLLRMGLNVGIDTLIGGVPILGDLFDFAW